MLLPGPLRRLSPEVAAALAGALCTAPPADWHTERRAPPRASDPEIDSFVSGHRTLEAALPALADLTRRRLGPALRSGSITLKEAALLMAATRQLRPVAELVEPFAAPGREALIERLRRLAGRIRSPWDR